MEDFKKSFMQIYSGPIRSDCCSHSIYTPTEKITVQEFADFIVTNFTGEWGYIGIDARNTIFGDPRVEYFHGHYVDEKRNPIQFKFPSKIANAVIKKLDWDGGWSRSDWLITI